MSLSILFKNTKYKTIVDSVEKRETNSNKQAFGSYSNVLACRRKVKKRVNKTIDTYITIVFKCVKI